jgi:nucleotide-binding universal stress UspA family protein
VGCYRTILVAFDGSRDAHAALQHAARLAGDQHARLVVMTVAPSPVCFTDVTGRAAVLADLEPDFIRELQEAVKALPPDISVESRLAHGDAARSILGVARECGCDLIVMGFHGHGRLHHALRGSVSDTVARESEQPVLLLRAPRSSTQSSSSAEVGGTVRVIAGQASSPGPASPAVQGEATEEPPPPAESLRSAGPG